MESDKLPLEKSGVRLQSHTLWGEINTHCRAFNTLAPDHKRHRDLHPLALRPAVD